MGSEEVLQFCPKESLGILENELMYMKELFLIDILYKNNICDLLEMHVITHYLLVLNKCLFEAGLNWSAFTVTCLPHEALCGSPATQATLSHKDAGGSLSRGPAVLGLPG